MFDKDHGGTISLDEIREVLSFGQNVDPEAIDKILKQADKNGDGEISFEEFCHLMKGDS